MKKAIVTLIKLILNPIFRILFSDDDFPKNTWGAYMMIKNIKINVHQGKSVIINAPYNLRNVVIGDYSYTSVNAYVHNTIIGKFCSIGPNFCCGLGVHPIDGISTSPMFYSTAKQNGVSLCVKNKVIESIPVSIGHDVFIGANVTILDGVSIGNGVVIGAGAVVTKNIPDYAIAVGVPAKVIKYRFSEEIVDKLKMEKWWDYSNEKLNDIEKHFFDVEYFFQSSKYE